MLGWDGMGIYLDLNESFLELSDVPCHDDDVRSLLSQLHSDAFSHSLGCPGEEDCLFII